MVEEPYIAPTWCRKGKNNYLDDDMKLFDTMSFPNMKSRTDKQHLLWNESVEGRVLGCSSS